MLPNAPTNPAPESDPLFERKSLELALLELPNVSECAVLSRIGPDKKQWVAYVVCSGPFSRVNAEELVRERFPELARAVNYAEITRLPFTDTGVLDELSLAALPVIDDGCVARAETLLGEHPQVERAAVFLVDAPVPAPSLHLSALFRVPEKRRAPQRKRTTLPGPAATGGTEPEPVARAPERSQERPLAVAIGEPLAQGSDSQRTLPDMLMQVAERVAEPRITYLAADGSTREQTLPELLALARRVCSGLQRLGIAQKTPVLLQLAIADQVLPAFWGCLLGGFVPVMTAIPPNYATDTNDLERLCHVVRLLGEPPLLTTNALRTEMGPLEQRVSLDGRKLLAIEELLLSPDEYEKPVLDPNETAFLSLTSGSTGAPKAIMLSHKSILARAYGTNELVSHDASDRILNWLPFDHIGSISDWHMRCIALGCHMVYCSKEYVLGEPLNWLRLIDKYRITHSWAPNFAYALVNDALGHTTESWDLSSMKSLLTAGEAVSSNTVHEFLRRLAPHGLARTALRPAFGMAELGSGVTYYLPTEEHPVRVSYVDRNQLDGPLRVVDSDDPQAIGFTSLGPVIPGTSMRIVDDANKPLPEYTVGRLQIAGGAVCLGYYENAEANREVFVEGGWFNTGDRGFIAERELYLTGRDKESLIINGANFYNGEIEAAVEQVDGIAVTFTAACAVRPRGLSEERLAIFFCPERASGRELTNLLRQVQNSVAKKTGVKPDFLLPVAQEVIPKTAIGKIQRKQLSRRFDSGEFDELVRSTDVLLDNDNTLPDWFLAPQFQRKNLTQKRAGEQGRRYVVLGDGHGLRAALVRELEKRGAEVLAADAAALPASVGFAGGAAPHAVVDLNDVGGSESAPAVRAEAASEHLVFLQRRLEQWLAGRRNGAAGSPPLTYLLVANHAQGVLPTEIVNPARATSISLLQAFSQENQNITARHVDLGQATDGARFERAAAHIAEECAALDGEEQVAYRGETRLLPGFAKVTWGPVAERPCSLDVGGVYLILGGLGGVGAELCRYLLQDWNARVILLGRTPLASQSAAPAGNEIDGDASSKAQILNELESLGTVLYRAADAGNEVELRRVVAEAEAEIGASLSGIFQLAGTYAEGLVTGQTSDTWRTVLGSKIDGAVAAHALLAERPHAFVACFSSLAGVFSGSGISAYAAANRFLDALSHEQRRIGRRSYSFNWSVWRGLGIGAQSAPVELLRSKGYHAIASSKGMHAVSAALTRGPCQLLIGIDPQNPNVRRHCIALAEPVARLVAAAALRRNASAAGESGANSEFSVLAVPDDFGREITVELSLRSALPLTEDGQIDRALLQGELRGAAREHKRPETPVQEQLAALWKDVLEVESVSIDDSFFDLGGTSLLSVRLFTEIEKHFGVSLPPATLFQAATVRALGELLDTSPGARSHDSLEQLATGTGKLALFLVHDADGEIENYRALAEQLVPKLSVYGLKPYQKDSYPALHTRIGEMVSYYVAKIRTAQPEGPYLLGGSGSGGLLAFEVACQLQASGQVVALVALFDASAASRPTGAQLLTAFRRSSAGATGRMLAARSELERGLRALGQVGIDYARVRLLRHYTDREQAPPWFLQHIPAKTVYQFARAGYQPSKFSGKVTLFRANRAAEQAPYDDTPAREIHRDVELGWGARASQGVVVVDVSAGHLSMLEEPAVRSVAEGLSAAISRELDSAE